MEMHALFTGLLFVELTKNTQTKNAKAKKNNKRIFGLFKK